MMRYRLARLKVAKWGYTLYRSPAFRLRIKRKFAARRIQKWFFIDCRVKRLKQKKQQEQYETAILQACTNNVFSKRVTFYAWGRFWYRRHMIKKKIAKDRKIFKTAYFKAFALVLRTEIQKREHLKRLRRFAYGRFLMELRKAYVTRRSKFYFIFHASLYAFVITNFTTQRTSASIKDSNHSMCLSRLSS